MHVIVVGGGLGGLAAALLLGRRGHRVALVESDADTPRGGPDQLFSGWARPGVPRHGILTTSWRDRSGCSATRPPMCWSPWSPGACCVSLAFAQAEHLALTVDGATDPLAYTAGFDSWTDAHIGVWYGPQAQADAAMVRRIEAAVAHQPTPPLDPAERLRSAAFHAARTDADVAVALRRMLHLVTRPGEVLGNPAVLRRLRTLVDARPELTAVAAGPTREELAA